MSFFELAGFRDENQVFGRPADFEARDWQDALGQIIVDKMAAHLSGTMVAAFEAGVGAGKTLGAAWASSYILNARMAERVVYVCPNRTILADAIADFRRFGIHLVDWENGKFPHGEPITMHGLAMTYASLNRQPNLQRKLCIHKPTLLCLDEFHHLGDTYAWCGAARDAFEGHVKVVMPFSGTPWRTDKKELPWMTTSREEDGMVLYAMDYSYPLGQCIADKVCRNPIFEFFGADVEIPTSKGIKKVNFDTPLNRKHSGLRLAGAVRRGTPSRTEILRRAVERIEGPGHHKGIFFLGGDTSSRDGSAKHDASHHLPEELVKLGVDPRRIVFVTSDDPKSSRKIREFNDSEAAYLITIDMVSEGINIPRLDTAVFLSSVTAKLKTIQRIGRVLRNQGHAIVLAFRDPSYLQISQDIEDRVKFYEALRKLNGPDDEAGPVAGRTRPRSPGDGPKGLSAWAESISVHGKEHGLEEVKRVREYLVSNGLADDDDRICTTLEFIDRGLLNLGA